MTASLSRRAIAAEYRPTPLYIAEFYQANDNKRDKTCSPARVPSSACPTIASCSVAFRITTKSPRQMFAAWMEILRRVDNGVLWLAADTVWSRDNLAAAPQNAGVDPARIVYAPRDQSFGVSGVSRCRGPVPGHLSLQCRYGRERRDPDASAAGDFVGSVIRLPHGRPAAGCLGAHDGIATTAQDYVEKAVALATDRSRYDAYKALFTDEAWAATIGNTAKFTEEFERSLIPSSCGRRPCHTRVMRRGRISRIPLRK